MIRSLILWLSKGILKSLLSLIIKLLHNGKSGLYSLVLICCAMLGSGQLVLGQNTNWWDDYQCFDASEIIDLWNFQNYDFGGKGGYSTPLQKDANGHIALFDYCANCGVGGSPVDTPVPLDASGHPTTPVPIGYARHAKWARSECGLAYYPRYKPTEYGPVDPVDVLGDCTPCACADGATNIACDLLPDLVVSGWKIANNDTYFVGNPPTPFTDKGHELDPNTFKLKVNITVGNLGDGPFEIKRTHTDLNGNPLEDDSEDDERIHQVIYKKPVGGSGTIIEDETANANEITGAFHAEHGHFHVNNWVDLSLRSRPDPTNNDPTTWPIIGTSNKLSFCIVESNTPTCKHQYSMLDLRTSEQMAYLNTNLNFWNSTDATLQSTLTTGATTYNHKIIYNQLSDFPNLALGKYNYRCEGAEHQAISPGYGDVYGTETPGNFINLPCDLAAGQYYIVVIVNPEGKFMEKPNGNLNNVTVVPYNFPGFTLPIPTAAPVNVQSWSYEEGEAGNTAIWTTPNRFNGMLIVPAGFTLTIQNTTMEFLTPGSGIIVQPGGTLILDNATLTNNSCLNNTWAGIHSWGIVIIDGCPMPLEAAISGVCLQNITATQSNTTINSFKAYQTAITPNNYTQNFSANLLGTQTSIPATFTYNPAGSTPYTFVSTINAGALCGGGTSLSGGGGFCKIYQNASSMPAISIAGGGSSTFCAGEGETLVAPLGYPNYIWSNGVTTAQNTLTTSGTYTVTVTNAWGCTATAQKSLTISTATVAITTTPTPNTCTAQLTATVSNAISPFTFEWNDQPALNTQSITVSQAGLNFVQVNNAAGCVGLATVTLSTNDIVPLNFNGTYTVGAMGANSFATPDLSGNETWTSLIKRISGTIVVPAGKTLTINSSTLTMVGTLTNIVVQPGGRLNLSGSILQADQCSSTYWQGISAKGNAVAYTNADPIIAFGTGNYGLVYATNSTIKNARIGVCNGLVQGSSVTNPGGIISLDNTTFTDCGIALRIAPTNFANQQPHLISNCTFKMALNTPFDASYWHPTELQPIGIWVKDVILPNTLYNNSFESTMPAATTTLDKRGIGMRLDNVRATIDAPTSAALEFNGLFKGIDVNNLLTAVKFIALKRQNFGNTRKALTLNNTYGSSVGYCSFAVPPGLTSLLDTYGIMSYYSKGITIDKNTFTTTNQANKHTKGAIFENSTNGSTPSVLTNNLFDGSFEVATQFKDTNAKLRTNCNAYDDCQADWHLTSTAILPEQGECDLIDPNGAKKANRTHWHYTTDPGLTGSNVRIKNSNTAFELKLNIDDSPQSNPEVPTGYVDGFVDVQVCSVLEGSSVFNNTCIITWPIAGEAKTETECSNGTTLEQAIYNYLQQDQRDSLLLLLQCIDEEWTQKLLIGTYVDEGQYDLALAEMQKLDSTTIDNAEFIALYTALMDSTLNTTPTEGGRIAMALNQTQAIANNPKSGNKTLAEAVLALCQNADYVRYGDPISFKNNLPMASNAAFSIVPNPSSGTVSFVFPEAITTNCQLTIYDISGRLVNTFALKPDTQQLTVELQNLSSGIYYCHLSGNAKTEKLVIIK